ncbi:MAG: hypothetical protein HRU49_11355 [Winogradskyella sp.]|uniref:hypothetical protein n=1 Tax=Winogradskyella sp. TaxID=1883156 RepID=UPI0025E12291|nr:hypothetical protein [Winogradskyella sp.]NRB84353.1 hypothetical protein [Winogradskyella sp.]
MKKIFLSLCVLSLLIITSCNNNDDDNGSTDPVDQLPPATQTGENTVGFLIDGIPISVTNSNHIGAFFQQGQLQIGFGYEDDYMDLSISILANSPLAVDTNYSLVNNSLVVKTNDDTNCFYDIDDTLEGIVRFTNIDETNFIISGFFEFTTVTEGCDTINITEGRFDVQYAP